MPRWASSVVLLLGAAQALPWDGASPTNKAELFPVRDYDFPIPTAAAELRRRQQPGDLTCAWEDGTPNSSGELYCTGQKVCATNTLGYFGCCLPTTIDDCALPTTCIDSTAVEGSLSSYGTDFYAISCTLPQNPYCITAYIELGLTVTAWVCGPADAARTQIFYSSDYNVTATSTETPVSFWNAVFTGYSPLTLISPSTTAPSTTAPTTTTTPSTTSTSPPSSTTTVQPTTTSSTPPPPSSPTPIGAIVGGVVGGIAVIGLMILGFFFLRRRRQQHDASAANAAGVQPAYPSGGVPLMQQMPLQGSPPIPQNHQYATEHYNYGDSAIQQAHQQPQFASPQQVYASDPSAAPAYPTGYMEKSPVQSTTSPQISNYSSAVVAAGPGVGQDQRASNVPLYSPTASELGPGTGGGGGGGVVSKGPVHEMGG